MSHSGSRQNNVRHKSHADIKNYVVNSSDEDWLDETFEKSNEAEDRFSAVDINNNNGKIQMVFKRQ